MNDVLGLMMTGIAVEAAMATTAEIHDLMTAYKKKQYRRSTNCRVRKGIS